MTTQITFFDTIQYEHASGRGDPSSFTFSEPQTSLIYEIASLAEYVLSPLSFGAGNSYFLHELYDLDKKTTVIELDQGKVTETIDAKIDGLTGSGVSTILKIVAYLFILPVIACFLVKATARSMIFGTFFGSVQIPHVSQAGISYRFRTDAAT